jgi:pyruvate/2-oxoglutarate dehydrogenase complex dihydrolipoamide acyltransferase (E2) component
MRAGCISVTPRAHRLIRRARIDPAVIRGTGPNGRIVDGMIAAEFVGRLKEVWSHPINACSRNDQRLKLPSRPWESNRELP